MRATILLLFSIVTLAFSHPTAPAAVASETPKAEALVLSPDTIETRTRIARQFPQFRFANQKPYVNLRPQPPIAYNVPSPPSIYNNRPYSGVVEERPSSLTLAGGNTVYTSEDGVVYIKTMTNVILTLAPSGTVSVTIPDGPVLTMNQLGAVDVKEVTGVDVRMETSGAVSVTTAEYNTIKTLPDGTVEFLFPDGRVIIVHPSGSVVQHSHDGTRRELKPDGSLVNMTKDEQLGHFLNVNADLQEVEELYNKDTHPVGPYPLPVDSNGYREPQPLVEEIQVVLPVDEQYHARDGGGGGGVVTFQDSKVLDNAFYHAISNIELLSSNSQITSVHVEQNGQLSGTMTVAVAAAILEGARASAIRDGCTDQQALAIAQIVLKLLAQILANVSVTLAHPQHSCSGGIIEICNSQILNGLLAGALVNTQIASSGSTINQVDVTSVAQQVATSVSAGGTVHAEHRGLVQLLLQFLFGSSTLVKIDNSQILNNVLANSLQNIQILAGHSTINDVSTTSIGGTDTTIPIIVHPGHPTIPIPPIPGPYPYPQPPYPYPYPYPGGGQVIPAPGTVIPAPGTTTLSPQELQLLQLLAHHASAGHVPDTLVPSLLSVLLGTNSVLGIHDSSIGNNLGAGALNNLQLLSSGSQIDSTHVNELDQANLLLQAISGAGGLDSMIGGRHGGDGGHHAPAARAYPGEAEQAQQPQSPSPVILPSPYQSQPISYYTNNPAIQSAVNNYAQPPSYHVPQPQPVSYGYGQQQQPQENGVPQYHQQQQPPRYYTQPQPQPQPQAYPVYAPQPQQQVPNYQQGPQVPAQPQPQPQPYNLPAQAQQYPSAAG